MENSTTNKLMETSTVLILIVFILAVLLLTKWASTWNLIEWTAVYVIFIQTMEFAWWLIRLTAFVIFVLWLAFKIIHPFVSILPKF